MYKLKIVDGRVRYLTRSGKDYVVSSTTAERADWMMKNKPIENKPIQGFSGFCVCAAGEYFYEGEWTDEKPQKKRRIKDKVCE